MRNRSTYLTMLNFADPLSGRLNYVLQYLNLCMHVHDNETASKIQVLEPLHILRQPQTHTY